MQLLAPLRSDRLYYRTLMAMDANHSYYHWLRDPEINQHLEVRHAIPNIAQLEEYVCAMNGSDQHLLLGIFLHSDQHIGNIKLGPIDWRNRRTVLGVLIGERFHWNQGYATEAIRAVTHYAFHELQLNRVGAGCYANNIGSRKAFMKAGFQEEGRLKAYWVSNQGYEDSIVMALCR